MFAVTLLAGGTSIQEVASNLGYESVPSFATMFCKALGISPGCYMVVRHKGANRHRSGPEKPSAHVVTMSIRHGLPTLNDTCPPIRLGSKTPHFPDR